MNLKIFQHLSKQISQGKLVWSLLTLNEYAGEGSDPLVTSLREKAKAAIVKSSCYEGFEDICELICQGAKMSDLNTEVQAKVRNISEFRPSQSVRRVVVPGNFQNRKQIRMNGTYSVNRTARTAVRQANLISRVG